MQFMPVPFGREHLNGQPKSIEVQGPRAWKKVASQNSLEKGGKKKSLRESGMAYVSEG
jgi:hypothetical protein